MQSHERGLNRLANFMPDYLPFLLVEDQEDDVRLVQRAFLKARILNPLYVTRSGEEAIAYLVGTGEFAQRGRYPIPGVVLLDIKLPGMDGFEVLSWIRRVTFLPNLRVVMLTSSDAMHDVTRAYEMGANSFLIKPADFERFIEISQALSGYWLRVDNTPDAPSFAGSKPASDTEIIRRQILAGTSRPS